MNTFFLSILQKIFPKLPIWALPLLMAIFGTAQQIVDLMKTREDLSGEEKRTQSAALTLAFLDAGLDGIPLLNKLTEAQRDESFKRIVEGVVELVYIVQLLRDLGPKTSSGERKLSIKMHRKLKKVAAEQRVSLDFLRDLDEDEEDEE